jgi:hypothetical protein
MVWGSNPDRRKVMFYKLSILVLRPTNPYILWVLCFSRGKVEGNDADSTLSSEILKGWRSLANFPVCIVRQYNSWKGLVKEKLAYLCTNGWCRLRNILLVKLCISWDDAVTAGNSLEYRFPEYLAVTFSRFVGCQKCQQIFDSSGQFLVLGKAKTRRV